MEQGIELPVSVLRPILSGNMVRSNTVIILVTPDPSGYPRPCLLSPYQVVGFARPSEVLFAVNSDSKTRSNLMSEGKCTFIFFTPPAAVYIEGKAIWLRETSNNNTLFRFIPTKIKEDSSDSAPIISKPLFDDSKVKPRYIRTYLDIILNAA
ncbi:MAG: hypothetical protein QW514_07385 [Thermoprotei archaeon]